MGRLIVIEHTFLKKRKQKLISLLISDVTAVSSARSDLIGPELVMWK